MENTENKLSFIVEEINNYDEKPEPRVEKEDVFIWKALHLIAVIVDGIFSIIKGIFKIFFDNMYMIYLYGYFGYGLYLMYTPKGIDNKYLFMGMWLMVVFFVDYIDKKKK